MIYTATIITINTLNSAQFRFTMRQLRRDLFLFSSNMFIFVIHVLKCSIIFKSYDRDIEKNFDVEL